MCILGLNVIQEAKQHLRVSVEEDSLDLELLTHLLPVPALVVRVREGGVEEEGKGETGCVIGGLVTI